MILILAPTRRIAEHVAQEIRVRDNWPRFSYNVTHRWLDPRDIRTSLVGQRGLTVVVATTGRAPHTLGEGWRGTAWKEALNWLYSDGRVYEPAIIFHNCP